jgi:hypothetical protein
MWTLAFGHHEDRTPTHGCGATRCTRASRIPRGAAIFGAASAVATIRRSPVFLKERAPGPSWRKGPGAIRAMPTTIAASSPSPQGHEQRRVSSPPQAKFGRGPTTSKDFDCCARATPSPMHAGARKLPRPLQVHPQKKSAPKSAQSAEVERRKLLANSAGLTCRCGDRLAELDHAGVSRAGAVCDARGKANADDQRREDERHCHHLQVGKAVGGKQRKNCS